VEAVGLAKMRVIGAAQREIERSEERVFCQAEQSGDPEAQLERALLAAASARRGASFCHHASQKLRPANTFSALDRIPGVGGARKRALLRALAASKESKKQHWKSSQGSL
jgi:excinuclease UvrABC nuclease subunit